MSNKTQHCCIKCGKWSRTKFMHIVRSLGTQFIRHIWCCNNCDQENRGAKSTEQPTGILKYCPGCDKEKDLCFFALFKAFRKNKIYTYRKVRCKECECLKNKVSSK